MLYPITLQSLRDRIEKYPLLARRSDADLNAALMTARAEVELNYPKAATGALSEMQDRIAATIQSDLALYYLRLDVERTEDGAPAPALQTYYDQIQQRLQRLAQISGFSGAMITAYEPLDPAEFPR